MRSPDQLASGSAAASVASAGGGGTTHSPATQVAPRMQSVLRMQLEELAQPASVALSARDIVNKTTTLECDTNSPIEHAPK